jgi:sulfatase maturation enzyme AslB (radical SAM superfamily)
MNEGRQRTLQLHPTRLCNLACTHCYTESGPLRSELLPAVRLAAVIAEAAALGYRQLAVSGGEPLLYPYLAELIAAGHRAGMAVAVTTNGTLPVTPPRRALLADADLLAISIDGEPAGHDAVRGRAAFARTERTVESVHDAGLIWGAIFTLTRGNLVELPEVVRFAAAGGARFVQVHALNATGRAAAFRSGEVPDDVELAAALVIAQLAGDEHGVPVLVDVATAADCVALPSFAVPLPDTLIVDPDGNAVPVHHDIHPRFRIGCILDTGLEELISTWQADGRAEGLAALERSAQRSLDEPGAPALLAWPDFLAARSHSS